MKRTALIVTIGLALAAGAGAFVAALGPADVVTGACGQVCPLGQWLGMPEPQCKAVCAVDPGFPDEARQLMDALARQREALAARLDDPAAADADILDLVEQVIAAHDALERRVARHILAIRPYLTADQARRLMGLCAQGVRQRGRCAGCTDHDADAGAGTPPAKPCAACAGSAGKTPPGGTAPAE